MQLICIRYFKGNFTLFSYGFCDWWKYNKEEKGHAFRARLMGAAGVKRLLRYAERLLYRWYRAQGRFRILNTSVAGTWNV